MKLSVLSLIFLFVIPQDGMFQKFIPGQESRKDVAVFTTSEMGEKLPVLKSIPTDWEFDAAFATNQDIFLIVKGE